jgi:hypothetical protein
MLYLLSDMVQDNDCPLNIGGVCYELVAHGFSEKQLREQGRMNLCEMGKQYNGLPVLRYHYCDGYQSFQTAHRDPGTISPKCCEAIRDAKFHNIADGRIVDLKSLEVLTAQLQKKST